jgi:hypothetical protein
MWALYLATGLLVAFAFAVIALIGTMGAGWPRDEPVVNKKAKSSQSLVVELADGTEKTFRQGDDWRGYYGFVISHGGVLSIRAYGEASEFGQRAYDVDSFNVTGWRRVYWRGA